MFANLKLRNRMLIGYLVPVGLFVGLIIPVFTSSSQVAESYKQTKISLSAIEGADGMAFRLAKMVGSARGYILKKDQEFLSIYNEDSRIFDETSQLVSKNIKNDIQKQHLAKMISLKNQYNEFAQKFINLVNQGKKEQAIALFATNQGVQIINDFNELNAGFNKKEHEILGAVSLKAEENLHFLLIAVILGGLLGITIALLAAYLISSGVTKTISQSVNAIASSSREIAATVIQQERAVTQQSSSVTQTSTTMDELGTSSQKSAQQAEAAADAAKQALALAEDGNQAVEQTIASIAILNEKVAAIAEQITRLSEQTNQIGSISEVVTDLANQTNMLALNASVEAVRAGEQGKGFAVVASEIRRLADQSKKSAAKINTLVVDIQKAISATVMATDEGTKTVEQGSRITQKTAAAFSGVSSAVNNVVVNNQQISLTAQQQAIAIRQVVDVMNLLNQAAKETAAGISQTKVGTQQLNEAAQNLSSIV